MMLTTRTINSLQWTLRLARLVRIPCDRRPFIQEIRHESR